MRQQSIALIAEFVVAENEAVETSRGPECLGEDIPSIQAQSSGTHGEAKHRGKRLVGQQCTRYGFDAHIAVPWTLDGQLVRYSLLCKASPRALHPVSPMAQSIRSRVSSTSLEASHSPNSTTWASLNLPAPSMIVRFSKVPPVSLRISISLL